LRPEHRPTGVEVEEDAGVAAYAVPPMPTGEAMVFRRGAEVKQGSDNINSRRGWRSPGSQVGEPVRILESRACARVREDQIEQEGW
jgi:hypothetical protein